MVYEGYHLGRIMLVLVYYRAQVRKLARRLHSIEIQLDGLRHA